jgi:hypothetical protein
MKTAACSATLLSSSRSLTQIGPEARRHCRDVVIGRIGFVAVRARCAGAPATTGPFSQERPIEVIFTNPPSVVTPRTVPHQFRPLAKENQCPVLSLRSGAVNFCCSERRLSGAVIPARPFVLVTRNGWPPGALAPLLSPNRSWGSWCRDITNSRSKVSS